MQKNIIGGALDEVKTREQIREMILAFAKVIDRRDSYTSGHSVRVAGYTSMLTKKLDYDEEIVENYYDAALLHDIGKFDISRSILNKPGSDR